VLNNALAMSGKAYGPSTESSIRLAYICATGSIARKSPKYSATLSRIRLARVSKSYYPETERLPD
jgi:hypothetical protein